MTGRPLRIVFFGSGAFGVPTLAALVGRHDVALVITQPDRPAGRGRTVAATPIAAWAESRELPLLRAASVQTEDVMQRIHAVGADAFVVIAFGQKLRPALLGETFAINLHGSLLPRHRGAAPVNWALLSGDGCTGVTVITLAERMDAGMILAERATPIDPHETAGELHDRLALLGPEVVEWTLDAHRRGTLEGQIQDESLVTLAPKLGRADAWVRFDERAEAARRRIHGLSPWPGCAIRVAGVEIKVLRAEAIDGSDSTVGTIGTLAEDASIRCATGRLRPLEIQPAGGRAMAFTEFLRGRRLVPGSLVDSVVPPPVWDASVRPLSPPE